LPPFFPYRALDETVETIPLCEATNEQLLVISQERRLALDLNEMQAIQSYFRQEARDPTDVELEMLAQTWSEHCVHKTFKAHIKYLGPPATANTAAVPIVQEIDGILKTYIRAATDEIGAPWVKSAFVDNAGIVEFIAGYDLAFKVETHNHPSALEPFGGANTGVGGCVRDVLGVSAKPIANTDILCFGPPELPDDEVPKGSLHPWRIAEGVIDGIEDYGNKMGIPTVNGAILHHRGYIANPLVYVGCLGILPTGLHPTAAQPGDLIIAIGGRTGRDGLRGATFSSMEMDVETGDIAGASVQIGNPIQEKQVQEVVIQARDERLYNAITDCGAGGFSSAIGEMAEHIGATVQLKEATLKYPGLQPWEIWLSEAQERMVLAVPSEKWSRLQQLCAGQDVEAICLGQFEPTGRLRLYFGDALVGDIDMSFLHNGLPRRHLQAFWQPPMRMDGETGTFISEEIQDTWLNLLSHPNIRSKENVVRRYDHEVQGGTALKPFVGAANHGPGDAAVLVPNATQLLNETAPAAIALGNGICPQFTDLDPYRMAWAAIDEAVRNVVAVGADPARIAILDNFCWGNPNIPDRLGALVRCAQGCYDAAIAYQVPFISGKDSLNNEYSGADGEKHAIPGTLLISALGIAPDVTKTVSIDFKQAGNFIYLLGATRGEMGGSHFNLINGLQSGIVPAPDPEAPKRYRAIFEAIQAGLVSSCHDCSEGGLAVALAEMAIAGRLGCRIDLDLVPASRELSSLEVLFSESLGRLVLEVSPKHSLEFESQMDAAGVTFANIGSVSHDFVVTGKGLALAMDLAQIESSWRGHVPASDQEGPSYEHHKTPAAKEIFEAPPSFLENRPSVLILHANGANRDLDAATACELAGATPEIVHINQLLAGERRMSDFQMLVVPGGFSYGDDLGAGALWALDLQHRLGQQMREFVDSGKPVLGICNGFQALVKANILPGCNREGESREVTLTGNQSGRFECRWVLLEPQPACNNIFVNDLDQGIYCPVAHGEGRFYIKNETTAANIESANLVALRYIGSEYPQNPNGSHLNIAGISNHAGNVLGLMPHPENHIFHWQHPRWRRQEGGLSGLRLFQNGVRYAARF
jgi:phosphoribosylformylglycinamidine synthase